jgi:glycosyltransferase involved in cell wall biosynthesis
MEAMPLAWLEVLAMGKTFIGSSTGPGPEAVKNNITGLLADPFKPNDIADKIRFVFKNEEKAIQLGINARENVLKDFDADVMVEKNIVFFKSKIIK